MIQVTSLNPDVWSIAPQGRIDSAGARSIEEAFANLFEQGAALFVVDFSEVSYMASAGLRVLMISLKRAKQTNGDVRLAALNPRVKETLRMSGLDTLFAFHDTVDEAVKNLRA